MNETSTETRSVVVEREIPHPPEKIWRALTQPDLIEEWLMKNDFKPVVGHCFNLRGDWGGVLDCEVLAIEPNKKLTYTWNFSHEDAAYDLRSVVSLLSLPRARGPSCAWSSRASGQISGRPTAAPRQDGSSSLQNWSRSWRGWIESGAIARPLRLVFRGGSVELE
jgi:uncharacterized protein YndB with AHSA1/START domain